MVIPTYNNLSLLLECLKSVQNLDYPRELTRSHRCGQCIERSHARSASQPFPYVRLVRLETNTGFAPACDRGAQEAKGEYVAFLNNDAVVSPDWLTALLAALKAGEEGTVCAASRILSRDGNETEYSGAASNLFGAGRPESGVGLARSSHTAHYRYPQFFSRRAAQC